MIASSCLRACGLEKVCSRMRSRCSAPSAVMKPAPKTRAISAIAGPRGAVVLREIASASMAVAPSCASIESTVLLPLPMPPVRPTRSAMALHPVEDEHEGQQLLHRLRADDEDDEPRCSEE